MSIQKLINECSWKHYLSVLKGGNNPNIHQLIYGQVKCGEGNGNPPQYSCLENPRDGGDWWAAVYGVTQSRTRLKWLRSSSIQLSPEKAMAPHSSTLAWRIPGMEEPGGLQSMRSVRVGHDRATSLSLFTFMYWRRKWQPIPVFLLGESQGWGRLVGCRLWGHTESDTTEVT